MICSQKTLTYTCTCTANNSAPAFQYYNPTMITNICNRYLGDCLKANAGRADQQDSCKTTIVCGNSSIDAYANSSAASSTSSASSSVASSTTGSTSSPSPTKNAAALLESCSNYGTGIFGAILLGAFGLYL